MPDLLENTKSLSAYPGVAMIGITTERPGLRLIPVAPGRWRVVDDVGRAIGHLEAVAMPSGVRYSARRFHAPTRSFRTLGDFWSDDEAIDCLRYCR